jgi:hypothetical protein
MRARHPVFLTVLAVIFALGFGQPAVAQDATPAGDAQTVSCEEIEPRDPASFEGMQGTPGADDAAGDEGADPEPASPTPFTMPEGEPADEAAIADVAHVYEQLIACLNAGDFLRAYALYTDEYLLRNLSEEALGELAATPSPVEESMQSEFGGVLEAVLLEDSRIAALVTVSNPQTGDIIIQSILTRDGDRLRIEDEAVVEAESTETSDVQAEGTPAA